MTWDNLAIVDVETTGGSPQYNRIIEIGIVLVDHNQITKTYSQLINPQTHLPPEITRLTGINPEDLETQPTFTDLTQHIFDLLNRRTFVAHNARFDYAFIKHAFRREGIDFTTKHLCSARLSRQLFPQHRRHSLDTLIDRHHLTCDARHRALGDAQVIFDFFKKLNQLVPETKITHTIQSITKTMALPPKIDHQLIKDLPEYPGVYIFYNADHAPLYIGKSVNLKDRILSHFYSDLENSREMAIKNELTDIEVIPTVGELEALLKEADLVKLMKPIYNRKLRQSSQLIGLKLTSNSHQYLEVSLHPLQTDSLDPSELYGIFRNKKKAQQTIRQLVKDNHLCWRLTGLESKSNGACFGHHLGQCRGACTSQESPAAYNLRTIEAFQTHKIQSWPFSGPIIIKESDHVRQLHATHIFNNWCHLATLTDDSLTPFEVIHSSKHYAFNLDNYKILHRFIRLHPNTIHVL
jgi:DNA polymerase-3 subunit epsilon